MGIPPLAFAIGMYLPLQINTPLFIGGLISHWVAKSQQGPEGLRGARRSRGTLLASGFIAGGALAGVLGALLNLIKTGVPDPEVPGDFLSVAKFIELPGWMGFSPDITLAQIVSIVCFVGLCACTLRTTCAAREGLAPSKAEEALARRPARRSRASRRRRAPSPGPTTGSR